MVRLGLGLGLYIRLWLYQRQNFFSMRVVNSWNSLPELVVTAPSVNTFKGRLDAHWNDLKFVVDFPTHELSNFSYCRGIALPQLEAMVSSRSMWRTKVASLS